MWAELPVWKQPTSLGMQVLRSSVTVDLKCSCFVILNFFYTTRKKKTAVYFKWTFFCFKGQINNKTVWHFIKFILKILLLLLAKWPFTNVFWWWLFSSVTSSVNSNLYVFVGPTFVEKWALKQICPLWCHKEQYSLLLCEVNGDTSLVSFCPDAKYLEGSTFRFSRRLYTEG